MYILNLQYKYHHESCALLPTYGLKGVDWGTVGSSSGTREPLDANETEAHPLHLHSYLHCNVSRLMTILSYGRLQIFA